MSVSNQTCLARFDQLAAVYHARHNFPTNETWPPTSAPIVMPDVELPKNGSVTQFTGCGPAASFEHFSSFAPDPSAIVVNITKIAWDKGTSNARVIISNCNGSETFNTTKAGVYVMRSPEFLIYIEREPQSQTPPYCPGIQRLDVIALPVEEYCQIYPSSSACSEIKKAEASSPSSSAPTTPSSTASTAKQSVLLTIASVCLMAVVSTI